MNNIKALRNKLGLTQVEFATRIGVTSTTVQNWEYGKTDPNNPAINAIVNEFGVSANWLLTGEGEMFVNPSQGSKDSKIKQLYPTPSQNSSEQDEEFLLTLMLSVDEWLKEEGLTMDPDKKINLIKLLRKFYTEHTDKITTDSVKNYAIPFALKLIN